MEKLFNFFNVIKFFLPFGMLIFNWCVCLAFCLDCLFQSLTWVKFCLQGYQNYFVNDVQNQLSFLKISKKFQAILHIFLGLPNFLFYLLVTSLKYNSIKNCWFLFFLNSSFLIANIDCPAFKDLWTTFSSFIFFFFLYSHTEIVVATKKETTNYCTINFFSFDSCLL